ncbi:hypothetical protein OHV05_38280 (plasmid) [Kitasatospora sp. NBC_00070]|uniref:hypothetical protein n=1 Tax=Kitasatospora sp. NBC_00070 TaxID=2975962 RepID=UPI003255B767
MTFLNGATNNDSFTVPENTVVSKIIIDVRGEHGSTGGYIGMPNQGHVGKGGRVQATYDITGGSQVDLGNWGGARGGLSTLMNYYGGDGGDGAFVSINGTTFMAAGGGGGVGWEDGWGNGRAGGEGNDNDSNRVADRGRAGGDGYSIRNSSYNAGGDSGGGGGGGWIGGRGGKDGYSGGIGGTNHIGNESGYAVRIANNTPGANVDDYSVNDGDAYVNVTAQYTLSNLSNHKAAGIAKNTTLAAGTAYNFGSLDHMGSLVMQGDGNLLAYKVNNDGTQGSLLWTSGTWGNNGAVASFGTDGVLRIKNGNTEIWHSEGAAGDKLRVDSGYIRTTDTNGKITWAGDVLLRGDTLATGGVVTTGDVNHGNGYRLSMQGDGNLVLYTGNWASAPWATGSWGGSTPTATFNTNGNFTVNATGGWNANLGTANRLALQGDGNLVAYNTSNQATWTR